MLRDGNVVLRGLELEDLEKIHIWMNDFEIITRLLRIEPSIKCLTEKWYFEIHNNYNKKIFAIEDAATTILIGCVGANNIDFVSRKSDFYIYIGDKNYRGKGYGKIATKLFIHYLFDYYNLNKIYLWVRYDNQSAINLYQNIGFKKEGHLRQDHFIDGQYIDVILMGLLKDEYLS